MWGVWRLFHINTWTSGQSDNAYIYISVSEPKISQQVRDSGFMNRNVGNLVLCFLSFQHNRDNKYNSWIIVIMIKLKNENYNTLLLLLPPPRLLLLLLLLLSLTHNNHNNQNHRWFQTSLPFWGVDRLVSGTLPKFWWWTPHPVGIIFHAYIPFKSHEITSKPIKSHEIPLQNPTGIYWNPWRSYEHSINVPLNPMKITAPRSLGRSSVRSSQFYHGPPAPGDAAGQSVFCSRRGGAGRVLRGILASKMVSPWDFSMAHGDFMEFCNQKCWFDDHQKWQMWWV